MIPTIQISVQRMICTGCGAEANASCSCGKPYVPKRVVAEEYAKAHPEASITEIRRQTGVAHFTAQRAKAVLDNTTPMDIHYSSATDEWSTPQDLFDELNAEFHFNLDVCATPSSAKCEGYFTPEMDGLAQDWTGSVWMNPPYGDVIGAWVEKARASAVKATVVVCLLPARVDTNWWWDNCRYGEIRFLRGRLKFGNSPNSAPFPSAVVIFGRPASVIWWDR